MSRHRALVLLLGALGSCMDDTVPEAEPGRPYCMIAYATRGHLADGSRTLVRWPSRSPAGCACIPPGQRVDVGTLDERWSDEVLTQLNDLAYEDCEEAAAWGNFVDSECREDYESGKWHDVVRYVGPDDDNDDDVTYLPQDLHCTDDLSTPGW